MGWRARSLVAASPVAATGRPATALAAATSPRGAGPSGPARAPTTTAARTSASVGAPPPTIGARAATASARSTTPKRPGPTRRGGCSTRRPSAATGGTLCTTGHRDNDKSPSSRCAHTVAAVGSTRLRGALKEDAVWGLIPVGSPQQDVDRCTSYLVGTPIFLYGSEKDGRRGDTHAEVPPLSREVEDQFVRPGRAERLAWLLPLQVPHVAKLHKEPSSKQLPPLAHARATEVETGAKGVRAVAFGPP